MQNSVKSYSDFLKYKDHHPVNAPLPKRRKNLKPKFLSRVETKVIHYPVLLMRSFYVSALLSKFFRIISCIHFINSLIYLAYFSIY